MKQLGVLLLFRGWNASPSLGYPQDRVPDACFTSCEREKVSVGRRGVSIDNKLLHINWVTTWPGLFKEWITLSSG